MAVVKDNAYGHGMEGVAKHLASQVEWFCVARVQEGILLRKLGIKNPILVFEIPEEEHTPLYPKYNLVATVADLTTFDLLEAGTKYHLNFDTGMKRLGLIPAQIPEVLEKLRIRSDLECQGIYTHFATADEENSEGVETQLKLFKSIRAQFPSELMTHTANTGAIFYYPEKDLQFDAVRPGVCLYGYPPGKTPISDLQPVMDWESYIMQVRKVFKGEKAGYGASWTAPKDGWIGTVPVGYSDGVPRILSGNFSVEVAGEYVPQAGKITMDYLGIFSDRPLNRGDRVLLFNGDGLNPAIWAQKAGTIPYEITTGLNSRIERSFKK